MPSLASRYRWKKRAAAIAKNQTLDPSEAQGLSPEEILSAFYGQVVYTREKDGWKLIHHQASPAPSVPASDDDEPPQRPN